MIITVDIIDVSIQQYMIIATIIHLLINILRLSIVIDNKSINLLIYLLILILLFVYLSTRFLMYFSNNLSWRFSCPAIVLITEFIVSFCMSILLICTLT